MAGAPRSRTFVAAALALTAAFVWSSYYFFVLALQARGVGEAPILADPFLAGGIAYLALALGTGTAGPIRGLLASPGAYARMALLVGMQLLVIVATYGIGAVDTSLLTLVGDVVLTPFLVIGLFREGRERLGSTLFLAGIVCCTVGAGLAIVAGGSTRSIDGAQWAVAGALPFAIAGYFVWTARAQRTVPTSSLVTHATLGAAVLAVLLAPWLPGGVSPLGVHDPLDLALLATTGVLTFFVGPFLYFRAIRTIGLILPSVLMATIPIFTVLLGIALDRSIPPWLGAIGIPLAVAGAYLAMRGEHALGPSPPAPA
jgi:drug/metabolite transporter (DMT)-like permease